MFYQWFYDRGRDSVNIMDPVEKQIKKQNFQTSADNRSTEWFHRTIPQLQLQLQHNLSSPIFTLCHYLMVPKNGLSLVIKRIPWHHMGQMFNHYIKHHLKRFRCKESYGFGCFAFTGQIRETHIYGLL